MSDDYDSREEELDRHYDESDRRRAEAKGERKMNARYGEHKEHDPHRHVHKERWIPNYG